MAVKSKVGVASKDFMPGKPKITRQGNSKNTKCAASSRNSAPKKYTGQGKGSILTVYNYILISFPAKSVVG